MSEKEDLLPTPLYLEHVTKGQANTDGVTPLSPRLFQDIEQQSFRS